MTEIHIQNIDKFKISELSDYYFNTTDLTRKIVSKKIKDIDTTDLLHLIRRQNYTEIATILALRDFERNGFYGFSFNYDAKSITQQDLLKELILLDSSFWNYNQLSFELLKPIAKKNGSYLNLSDRFTKQFLEIKPEPIVWTKDEIERINSFIEMDIASSVHSAWEMLRTLKRAIDEGISMTFNWQDNIFIIKTGRDIEEKIISLLPHASDFKKAIDKEIKILR